MVCVVESQLRERVLKVIEERSPLPTELVELLREKMSYREIQDALSELLESGEVALDSHLHLRIKSRAA